MKTRLHLLLCLLFPLIASAQEGFFEDPLPLNSVGTDATKLPLAGGVLTGEVTVDNLGLEFTAGDDHSDCSAFSSTGGGLFFDDSDGEFKKCEDNTLSPMEDPDASFTGRSVDLDLFGGDTVGDTTDGHSVYARRTSATEGNSFIRMFVNEFEQPHIEASSTGPLALDPGGGFPVLSKGNLFLGQFQGANFTFRHYGNLTGPGEKYVQFLLNDSTDTYELTRVDTNILGFDIQIPLEVDALTASGVITGTDAVLTTPDLGTPSALVLTNATGTLAGTVDLTAGMVDAGDYAAGSIDNADISSTISFLTSGTIRGAVDVVATTGTSLAVSADQSKGSMHTADNTSVVTFTLPAVTTGLSACFYDLDAIAIITVDVQTGDIITLDGTALSAGDSIDSAGAKGDFICLLGLDTTNWLTLGRSGTWVDGDP